MLDNRRRLIDAWQDRIRDPSLTVLLVLEICAIFLAAPLGKGAAGCAGGRRYTGSCGPCDRRAAVAEMGRYCLDPAGADGLRRELSAE